MPSGSNLRAFESFLRRLVIAPLSRSLNVAGARLAVSAATPGAPAGPVVLSRSAAWLGLPLLLVLIAVALAVAANGTDQRDWEPRRLISHVGVIVGR